MSTHIHVPPSPLSTRIITRWSFQGCWSRTPPCNGIFGPLLHKPCIKGEVKLFILVMNVRKYLQRLFGATLKIYPKFNQKRSFCTHCENGLFALQSYLISLFFADDDIDNLVGKYMFAYILHILHIGYWVLHCALFAFLSICINYRTGMIWVKVNYTSFLTLNSRIYHRGPRMFKGMNPSQCSSNHSQFLWKPGLPVSRVNFQNLTYCVNLGNLCEFCELGEFVEMCLLDELKDEVGERMCTKLG